MSFVKRTRIVSVRVTQDEYQALDQISRRRGANSVSEFLRQLIMNSEPFASTVSGGTRQVTEELAELRRKVEQLSQIVRQRPARQSTAEAASDEKEAQAARLWQESLADV